MTHEEMFGKARWVGFGDTACPLVRGSFDVAGEPESAELVICGLGFFDARINGRPADDGLNQPVYSNYCRQSFNVGGKPFDEVMGCRTYAVKLDVSELVRRGENVLAVWLAPGWFGQPIWCDGHEKARYGDTRLCFSLKLRLRGGGEQTYISGGELKYTQSIITDYDLFLGETHDYTSACDGWDQPGFDDSSWRSVSYAEPLVTEYMYQDCQPDRVVRRIPIVKLAPGLYDVGENITGTPVLVSRRAQTVKLRFYECLRPDGTPDDRTFHGQDAKYITDGRERRLFQRFTWHGFRYFTVEGEAEPEECLVIHSDIPVTAEFSCSNDTLNWLFEAYLRTQLDNMHAGIPSDCPHIERRGYTGDGQNCCRAAMLMLDSREFYRKWMRDISDCQDRITGHVQYTAPYTHCGGGPGGWGCAIVHVPYEYYKRYGDAGPMREMFPQILKYFDYLDAHSENGLVTSDRPGEWCLGDWCTPKKIAIPEPLVNNYFYIKSLNEAREIAEVIGAEFYPQARLAERTAALYREYFDAATGDFAGNTQGANAFMLDIGLGDGRTAENTVRHYLESGHYDTGIFGTDVLTRTLFALGRGDVAFRLLTAEGMPSFNHLRSLGATTLWEYWQGQRSYNHPMFGAVSEYLFSGAAGITQRGAGWTDVVIEPQLIGELPELSASIDTVRGRVGVSYSASGGEVRYAVSAPEGVRAVLRACDGTEHIFEGKFEYRAVKA